MLKNKKNRIQTRKGISLVEIMISVFVFSIAITGFLKAVTLTHKTANTSMHRTCAIHLGVEKMEMVKRNSEFGEILKIETVQRNGMVYTRKLQVTPGVLTLETEERSDDQDGEKNLGLGTLAGHQITVEVSWLNSVDQMNDKKVQRETLVEFVPALPGF